MPTVTRVDFKPLTLEAACARAQAMAEKTVHSAQMAGVPDAYGAWVDRILSDSREPSCFHPSSRKAIGRVWPYLNRLRHSQDDLQIDLAVQVAIILEIGNGITKNTWELAAGYPEVSLRHGVTEAQAEVVQLIKQLVDRKTKGIDLDAPLYRRGWVRQWELITAMHDNSDES